MLATDALIMGGGKLTEISEQTMAELNEFLPSAWSHNNPIDILGDASPELYAKTLEIAAKDKNADGLLVILTPQDMTDPTRTAEQLRQAAASLGRKPVLASWMGGADVAAGVSILNRASIPDLPLPGHGGAGLQLHVALHYNLKGIYETPSLPVASDAEAMHRNRARQLIDEVREKGRTILTEYESKQIFAAYGIPTVETRLAASVEAAVTEANTIGYPVVLKLNSETITHKSDVKGVQLNLRTEEAVRTAFRDDPGGGHRERHGAEHFQGVTVQPMIKLDGYELIIGSSLDAQFGPVLLFGTGGVLVEVYKDRALALPPLNTTLARRMMEQTKIWEALQGRARPQAGRHRGAGAAAGALQPARRRAALDQGDRHQPAAGLAGADHRARCARGAPRPDDPTRTTCRARRSVPSPRVTVRPLFCTTMMRSTSAPSARKMSR